jgi:hypothetical protein
MSAVYNPEAETKAQIERLELESRDLRKRLATARKRQDKRSLEHLMKEAEGQITVLRQRLP